MSKDIMQQSIEQLVKEVLGSLRIEGIELTHEEQRWLFAIALEIRDGRMTTDEVVANLVASYIRKEN